jgi:hypothetical protein
VSRVDGIYVSRVGGIYVSRVGGMLLLSSQLRKIKRRIKERINILL